MGLRFMMTQATGKCEDLTYDHSYWILGPRLVFCLNLDSKILIKNLV